MDFLRDPVWQFIGAAISLIAVFVTVYIFTAQRSKKSLAYGVLTATELLSIKEEIKGKVQILFENRPVKNVYHVLLKIVNDGSLPINASQFERPLSFSFSNESTVLSADVAEVHPSTLHPVLIIENNRVGLKPTLLNSGDTIQLSLLLSQHDGTINVDARIEGIPEVKEGIKTPLKPAVRWVISFIVSSILGMILLFVFVEPSRPFIIMFAVAIIAAIANEFKDSRSENKRLSKHEK